MDNRCRAVAPQWQSPAAGLSRGVEKKVSILSVREGELAGVAEAGAAAGGGAGAEAVAAGPPKMLPPPLQPGVSSVSASKAAAGTRSHHRDRSMSRSIPRFTARA